MSQVINYFSALAIPKNIAGDMSFLLIFIGASLALGFVFGRWKIISIIINVYIVLAFISVLPASLFVMPVYSKSMTFILLLVVLTAIDRRLFDLHISNASSDFFWRLLVMSLLMTGMIVSAILSFLPKVIATGFISVTVYGYFASSGALIFWMVTPLLSLLFINKRLR
jgi:hypothetical protein